MATTFETDDGSIVEFQLGNKQLFLLFMGLLVICAIFFFIGLRVGEDTMRGKSALMMSLGQPVENSENVQQVNNEQMLSVNSPIKNARPTAEKLNIQKPANKPVRRTDRPNRKLNNIEPNPKAANKPDKRNVVNATKRNKPQTAAAITSGWFVQVAAPRDAKAAEKLRSRLSMNQPTIIQKANVKGTDYYRVRIGPFAGKAKADKMRQSVLASFKEAFLVKN